MALHGQQGERDGHHAVVPSLDVLRLPGPPAQQRRSAAARSAQSRGGQHAGRGRRGAGPHSGAPAYVSRGERSGLC